MSWTDAFSLSVRSIVRTAGRAVLTILAVALASALLTALLVIAITAKQERDWFPDAAPKNAALTVLLRRPGASLLRISRPRRP